MTKSLFVYYFKQTMLNRINVKIILARCVRFNRIDRHSGVLCCYHKHHPCITIILNFAFCIYSEIKLFLFLFKGRQAYTTFKNHTFTILQFKTGVPQGCVLSPILFNIYTSDMTQPQAPVQVTSYADDITNTSTHTRTKATKAYIQHCLTKVHT